MWWISDEFEIEKKTYWKLRALSNFLSRIINLLSIWLPFSSVSQIKFWKLFFLWYLPLKNTKYIQLFVWYGSMSRSWAVPSDSRDCDAGPDMARRIPHLETGRGSRKKYFFTRSKLKSFNTKTTKTILKKSIHKREREKVYIKWRDNNIPASLISFERFTKHFVIMMLLYRSFNDFIFLFYLTKEKLILNSMYRTIN